MGKFTFWGLFADQWARLPPPLHTDLSGKTVLVIGANTGIGLEAAKHFAKMNPARLIIGCRSEERGRTALEAIANDTSYAAELRLIDLASFSSVRSFVAELRDDPVDIMVANAGIATREYGSTDDGWEQTLQVNHLSTALVSFLLLPNMVKAAELHQSKSRLVIVCSETHFWVNLSDVISAPNLLQTMNDKQYCTPEKGMAHRYPDTKLFNVFFTRALAQRLKTSTPIVASTVNPGYCYTELRRNVSLTGKIRMGLMDIVMGRTAEQGARQLIWAALGPDGQDGEHTYFLHGAYVSNAEVREPSDFVISKEGYGAQEKLWYETIDVLKAASPELDSILQKYF